jgi:hypothetical protein
VGKHAKIEPGHQVASVFVPISRGGLSKTIAKSRMAQGSADVLAVSDVHPAANVAGRRFLRFGMTVQEASVLLRCVEARRVTPGSSRSGLEVIRA